jgi:hypothetical protein
MVDARLRCTAVGDEAAVSPQNENAKVKMLK